MSIFNKFFFGDSNYGFFDHLDQDNIKRQSQLDIKHFDWMVTNRFKTAKNHCASTTSTNLDIYFSKLNYLDDQDIFNEHHKIIGNGPVIKFDGNTKKILKNKAVNVESNLIFFNKMAKIKAAIDRGNVCIFLLSEALFNWHWVICVGYQEMKNGDTIFTIIDNWHNFTRYYQPGKGSSLVYAVEFTKIHAK